LNNSNNKEDTKMKTTMRSAGLGLAILVAFALPLALVVGLNTAFSGEGPKEVQGFGEAEAEAVIKFHQVKGGVKDVKSFGKIPLGAIGDTVGNSFTFAFGAIKDANGKVQGQIFVRDHTLNMTVSGDVAGLTPHPKHRSPVGIKARGLNYGVKLTGSKTSVVVNGETKPGWYLNAGPTFDGEKDIVCFGLYDPTGKKPYQWQGVPSAGDVRTK
jgi:hypothetical protein